MTKAAPPPWPTYHGNRCAVASAPCPRRSARRRSRTRSRSTARSTPRPSSTTAPRSWPPRTTPSTPSTRASTCSGSGTSVRRRRRPSGRAATSTRSASPARRSTTSPTNAVYVAAELGNPVAAPALLHRLPDRSGQLVARLRSARCRPGRHAGARGADDLRLAGPHRRSAAWPVTAATTRAASSASPHRRRPAPVLHRPDGPRGGHLDAARPHRRRRGQLLRRRWATALPGSATRTTTATRCSNSRRRPHAEVTTSRRRPGRTTTIPTSTSARRARR